MLIKIETNILSASFIAEVLDIKSVGSFWEKKYFLSCNFSYLLGNSSYSFLEKQQKLDEKPSLLFGEKKIKEPVALASILAWVVASLVLDL